MHDTKANNLDYWVRANVAPMQRNGQLVGYISVHIGVNRFASALQLMPAAWRVRVPILATGASFWRFQGCKAWR